MTIQKLPANALEDLNLRRRVVETLNQITEAPTWIAPTLLNSWVDFGGDHAVAGFYKDSLGRVHLRGLIEDGTTAASTVLFVLPAGYRPAGALLVSGRTSDAAQTASGGARLDIHPNGEVLLISGDVTGFGDGAYLSLNGISFLAEQ